MAKDGIWAGVRLWKLESCKSTGRTFVSDLKKDQEQEKASALVQAWVWGVTVFRKYTKSHLAPFSWWNKSLKLLGGRVAKLIASGHRWSSLAAGALEQEKSLYFWRRDGKIFSTWTIRTPNIGGRTRLLQRRYHQTYKSCLRLRLN